MLQTATPGIDKIELCNIQKSNSIDTSQISDQTSNQYSHIDKSISSSSNQQSTYQCSSQQSAFGIEFEKMICKMINIQKQIQEKSNNNIQYHVQQNIPNYPYIYNDQMWKETHALFDQMNAQNLKSSAEGHIKYETPINQEDFKQQTFKIERKEYVKKSAKQYGRPFIGDVKDKKGYEDRVPQKRAIFRYFKRYYSKREEEYKTLKKYLVQKLSHQDQECIQDLILKC